MKEFTLHSKNFEKWLYQNDGEILEKAEGCLLDNYLIVCKNGFAAAYETYKNCWTSVYTVKFERSNPNNKIFIEWDEFVENMEG